MAARAAHRAQILPHCGIGKPVHIGDDASARNGSFRNCRSSNDLDRPVGLICVSGRLLQACNGVHLTGGRARVTFGEKGASASTTPIEKSLRKNLEPPEVGTPPPSPLEAA